MRPGLLSQEALYASYADKKGKKGRERKRERENEKEKREILLPRFPT